MSKPALLVLTSTFPRWAGDHEPPFVFELARRLTAHFEVTVLAPHARGAKHLEMMDGVRVERFRYAPAALERLAYDGGIPTRLRRQPWLAVLVPLFILGQLIHARRLVRRLQPQAIHAHWLLPQGLVAVLGVAAGRRRPRLLVTAHGADLHGLNTGPARWIKRLVLRRADVISVVSGSLASHITPLITTPGKLHVAPMGVDLMQTFVPASEKSRGQTLVFAGRLVEKKGLAQLLDALPMILSHRPDCRLLVAGDGPLRATLEARAQRLDVAAHVVFQGRYRNDELPGIFGQADVGVFPFQIAAGGDQEGLGLVTVEAMGCGLPVVVGDVPAVHDVVAHEHNGLIVPAGDSTALAAQILRLLDDPALATRLAITAREEAMARFDWQVVTDRYAQLLNV